MLIPWKIKYEKCARLIEEICDIIQKDLTTTLCSSFLSIYTYLNLNETAEVNSKSMSYVMQSTENSLHQLLKSDVKVSAVHAFNPRQFHFMSLPPVFFFSLISAYVGRNSALLPQESYLRNGHIPIVVVRYGQRFKSQQLFNAQTGGISNITISRCDLCIRANFDQRK